MTAVIIIIFLSLALIGFLVAFIWYINNDKGSVEPYKPTPDPIAKEIQAVDDAIKSVNNEIDKKLERSGENESDTVLLNSFKNIKL